jgi:hypothetical protein
MDPPLQGLAQQQQQQQQQEMDPHYLAALKELGLTPQEQYMFRHHLGNLRRGGVKQPGGQTSTYLGSTFEIGGRHYMLPTVWDNQVVPPDAAVGRARAAGLDNWPSYASEDEAEQRYDQIHGYMERNTTDMEKRRQ